MDSLFEIILGLIVAVLALFGFKKFQPKDLPPELSDDRVEELEEKLDELEEKEKQLEEDGVKELSPEEVEGYWNGKK